MEELAMLGHRMFGRDAEFSTLKHALDKAIRGDGSTVFISGEAGIGKTRLIDAFKSQAETGTISLSGSATSGSVHPFQVFSKALEGLTDKPLFEEQEYTSFTEIFAVNDAGMLLAKASSEEGGLDADIFAGMLSAVQDFVRDSFGGGRKTGLGRLEYGDMKILIEHGQHLFLTAVFSGTEHLDMKNTVKQALKRIEESHGQLLGKWTGKMSDVAPVQDEITKLAGARFLVRKDLEGVKLENERLRIADRVLEMLGILSAEMPLLMFLEDLHWADESSLFVLNYLARNIRKSPILLVGTFRPGESGILQRTMENMMNEDILDDIALEKLDVENTVSLINDTLAPNDFPDTLAKKLFEQSRGNPLFVVEMLRGMHDDGSIAERDGRYILVSDSYQVPATVEEVVNRRLGMLDPDSMAMVEYVSCIGQRFDASMAASNRMVKDPEASLKKLAASGIISLKKGSAEFNHAVFQSVIYNGIGERWRHGHHKSLGEYLESAFSDRLDDVMYELARHFSKTTEYMKFHLYCTRAGEKAERSFAVEQALGFYRDALTAISSQGIRGHQEKGLEILERCGDLQKISGNYAAALGDYIKVREASADDMRIRARILRKVGEVREKIGEYDSSLEALAEARAIVDIDEAEHGKALFAEGMTRWRKGETETALSLFSECVKIARKSDFRKVDMGNALRAIGNIHHGRGEPEEARMYLERSLKVMEEMQEPYGIASALNCLGILHTSKADFQKALEFLQRSCAMNQKIGDRQGIAMSLNNIGNAYSDMGEFVKALEAYGGSLEILERIGDKKGVANTLNNIGLVHYGKGDLNEALEFFARSIAIKEKIGNRHGIATSLGNMGMVHGEKGDLDKAEEAYRRCKSIFEDMGEKRGVAHSLNNIGIVHMNRGELGLAMETLEGSLATYNEIGDRRLSVNPLCSMVEVHLMKGKIQAARKLAEETALIASEFGAKPEEAMSLRTSGIVHREEGNFEYGMEDFRKAEGILREIGERGELARLFHEMGLNLVAMGDKAKARECLEMALSEFQRMGMELWAERCRKAIDGL